MKKNLIASLLLSFMLGGAALAGGDGWDKGSRYNNLYDASTVQTMTGQIVSINREWQPLPGMSPGVMAVVETPSGRMNVQLGPRWFTKFYQQDWALQPGDKVEFTGSVIDYQGSPAMILRSGEKGDHKMVVRKSDGSPVWDPEASQF